MIEIKDRKNEWSDAGRHELWNKRGLTVNFGLGQSQSQHSAYPQIIEVISYNNHCSK